jgi:alpha-tubulin suppressor-like RCC1 family protein
VIQPQDKLDFNVKFRYKASVASLPALTSLTASFSLVFEKVTPPILAVTNDRRNFEVYRGNIATPPSNLYNRVAAVDEMDGNITSQIVRTCTNSASQTVACPTTWYGQVRDNYKITFNVTNSLGLSAVPISFAVKTWDFVEIEGGEDHSFALSSDGRVWAWGYGANGRLGLGSTSNQTSPVYQSNLAGSTNVNTPIRRIVSIAANRGTSYAVDDSGQLWAWGDRSYSALGLGGSTSGNETSPVAVTLPSGVKAVEVDGNYHTGIVRTDTGDIYVWGYNTNGSAGTGNTTTIATPTKLTTMTVPVKKVAMGENNGAAIDTSGNLWTWGSGTNGKLGYSGSGSSNLPGKYSGLTNVKDIKIGDEHMLALMENGDVYVWGNNYYGRLCSSSSSITSPYKIPVSNVVDIAVFMNSSHMVTADGKAYSCGGNTYGEIQVGYTGSPSGSTGVTTPTVNYQFASGITTISANTDTSHILISNMTAYGYGHNNNGQIGNNTTTNSAAGVIWNFTVPAIYEW